MKKINISVRLKLVGMTGPILSVPAEVENAVYSQLLAHKDVHYSYEDSGTWKEVIIPYLAIVYAELDSTSSSVDAPTDAFCASECLVVTPPKFDGPGGDEPFELIEDGSSCYAKVFERMFDTVTYNGEPVDEETFAEEAAFEIDGATRDSVDPSFWDVPVACNATEVTCTIRATYEGCTDSMVLTWPIQGGH